MRRFFIALSLICLALAARADDDDFRPLPLHQAAELVAERYAGRLVAAQLAPPTRDERHMGVELVEELRLLTPARNLLTIRLDARTGRFLDVAGVGQTEARIR